MALLPCGTAVRTGFTARAFPVDFFIVKYPALFNNQKKWTEYLKNCAICQNIAQGMEICCQYAFYPPLRKNTHILYAKLLAYA